MQVYYIVHIEQNINTDHLGHIFMTQLKLQALSKHKILDSLDFPNND